MMGVGVGVGVIVGLDVGLGVVVGVQVGVGVSVGTSVPVTVGVFGKLCVGSTAGVGSDCCLQLVKMSMNKPRSNKALIFFIIFVKFPNPCF